MADNFYRKVLKNGMTILFEKRDLAVVSVAFAVRSGGIDEEDFEKGISHFIEHMLYKGTKKRNVKEIAEEIEKNGGELNGFTDETITAFWCKMPSKHIQTALEVLGDMVKEPLFDEKEVDKERKVIFEELKMRKDRPDIYVHDKILNMLYTGALSMDLIGTYESMNANTREKLVERFKKIYQPNNMILSVVGDADFDKLVKFAEDNFGNEKGSVKKLEVGIKNENKIEERKGIDQANLVFAYQVPLASDKKNYAARILNSLMASGLSSRLFSEIREKRNLAYAVKGNSSINKYFSYNSIYIGTTKDNMEKVKELILKEFEKVSKELTEKELNQIKEQLVGNYQISTEDSQMQMVNLLNFELNGDASELYDFENNVKSVKIDDVKEIAKMVAKNHSFFALVPK